MRRTPTQQPDRFPPIEDYGMLSDGEVRGLYTLELNAEAVDLMRFVADVAQTARPASHHVWHRGRALPCRADAGSIYLHTSDLERLPEWIWPLVEQQVGEGRRPARWREAAEEIHADICDTGVDERGVLVQRYVARRLVPAARPNALSPAQ